MPTLRELETELGLAAGTLTSKADVATKWDGYFSAADQKTADAQRKLDEAQQLQSVIDQNITQFGLTEANVAQLQANNAALTAALEEVKKQGFSGLNIPSLPTITKPTVDPMDALRETIANGFANVGQTLGVSTRYQRVFGQPLPDDPAQLAQEAAQRRMNVSDYAEQKYGITAAEQKQVADRAQKEKDDYAAIKVKEYQEAHPSHAGNPELNGGYSSKFPAIPKPRDSASVREFSSMSAREKIASAMTRANEAAKTSAGSV